MRSSDFCQALGSASSSEYDPCSECQNKTPPDEHLSIWLIGWWFILFVSHRCENNGTCIDGSFTYNCSCPQDYYGEHCECTPIVKPVLTSRSHIAVFRLFNNYFEIIVWCKSYTEIVKNTCYWKETTRVIQVCYVDYCDYTGARWWCSINHLAHLK